MQARTRAVVSLAAALFLADVVLISTIGTRAPGPAFSDLIQCSLAGLLVYHCAQAARRSMGLARSFWFLATATFVIVFAGMVLLTYGEMFPAQPEAKSLSSSLLWFWFFPLALGLFLDPERETEGLDLPLALDFMQAGVFCVAAYLYFFYIPNSDAGGPAHFWWTPYFAGYAFLGVAFSIRSVLTRSTLARSLFRGLVLFLAYSTVADVVYRFGPGRGLTSGSWIDLLWSMNSAIPLILAAAWNQPAPLDVSPAGPQREKRIYTEILYLVFPFLILLMSMRIARQHLGLAALIIFLSFAFSSARLLVTQHRLVRVQDALRWEASRDGLTGLWNRKAVLEILERELVRAERHGAPVGVIMADADHFKSINDTRGHAVGDRVLAIIASEIAAVVRPYDSVGRYGGEEFLIIAPDCGPHATWELAERVRRCISNSKIVDGGSGLAVTLSLGIASGSSVSDVEKLLHAADTALYEAKHAGRNRVLPRLGDPEGTTENSSDSEKATFWL